jgi:hypothetical protein
MTVTSKNRVAIIQLHDTAGDSRQAYWQGRCAQFIRGKGLGKSFDKPWQRPVSIKLPQLAASQFRFHI